jgi:hypothetical protein
MADGKPVVIYIELDDGSMVEIELVKKPVKPESEKE